MCVCVCCSSDNGGKRGDFTAISTDESRREGTGMNIFIPFFFHARQWEERGERSREQENERGYIKVQKRMWSYLSLCGEYSQVISLSQDEFTVHINN